MNPTGKLFVTGIPFSGLSSDFLTADSSSLVDPTGVINNPTYTWYKDGSATAVTGISVPLIAPDWENSSLFVRMTYLDGNSNLVTVDSAALTYLSGGSTSYTIAGGAEFVLGLEGNDTVIGGAGNDTLNGCDGNDSMAGGLGDDLYYVQNTGDKVVEGAGEGSDRVVSSINYTLGANLETLGLADGAAIYAIGNALDNSLRGNSNDNQLRGLDGNDTLNGSFGADTMYGGNGNDIYYVDNTSDVVTEFAGQGTDTVMSTVTYTLRPDVDNLTLTGTAAINATGNDLANVLSGNTGNNVLDGRTGADTMRGGAGDDTYYVENVGDVTQDITTGGGTDVIYASASHTMGSGIETMYLMGGADLNATGSSDNNVIYGNAGANVLNGSVGADTLIGGNGNDTYYVDNIGDVVTETSSTGGYDIAYVASNWTVGVNVDEVHLTGTASLTLHGNYQNNLLYGSAARDTILGEAGNDTIVGGAGYDTMTGGNGADVFRFTALTDSGVFAGTRDVITDFRSDLDKIDLSAIDADDATVGDQAFSTTLLDSATAFSHAGEMKLVSGILYLNTDTDAAAEMTIQLTGVTKLLASSFIA